MTARFGRILKELFHHLPYSAVGVGAALGILLALEKIGWQGTPKNYFHITHPAHIFLSAIVTTALFWKYEPKLFKAILVGFFGTLPICTVSDIVMPYLGGLLFKTPVQFHLCIIEEPWLVFPACGIGIVSGMALLKWIGRLTEFGHLSHVLVSSLASFLYLIAFDISLWQGSLFISFLITVLAVWIPCCLSDIVFPLAFVKGESAPCCGHAHH